MLSLGGVPVPGDWQTLWKELGPLADQLRLRGPQTKAMEAAGVDGAAGQYKSVALVQQELKSSGECRSVVFNIGYTDPSVLSIKGDVLTMQKVLKATRMHFWDKDFDLPRAPKHWVRDRNIPLAVVGGVLPDPGVYKRYGRDNIVRAYWVGLYVANKYHENCETAGKLDVKHGGLDPANRKAAFLNLGQRALADYLYITPGDGAPGVGHEGNL